MLKEANKKARHLYWLNPEPKSYWDTGDSVASVAVADWVEAVPVTVQKTLLPTQVFSITEPCFDFLNS